MGEEEYEGIGFEVGGVDYITKPVRPFLLKPRVRTHIELKRKNDYLKALTSLDGLTGIANRRRMDEFVDQEWRRAVRRGGSNLSYIMMDVDFFKRFNDGYGHQMGDDCLRKVAGAIESSMMRGTDLVARYGGEEFACVLPETALIGAIQLSEKIQSAISALAIPHKYSDVSDFITVSVGVATVMPMKNQQFSMLLESADQQLYQAKQEGRNRICYVDLTNN